MKNEAEGEIVKAKEAARGRVLEDFEKGQLFANPAVGTTTSGADSHERTFFDMPSALSFNIARPSSRNEAEIRV
jgi:hypothetical protein